MEGIQAPTAAGPEQFELLSRSFLDYKVCAQSPGSVNSKCQLTALTEKLQKQGICGNNALQLLNSLKQQISWHTMHPEEFRCFYQFVFFICRDQGKRNVQVPVAIAAWRGLLEGRFRLLDRWCAFMSHHYKPLVVTEDTWTQLLEFSRTVLEDLSNYDPTAAWPVALDEFVEHIRRTAKKAPEPMDLSSPWPPSEHLLAAVSPRSGSKRRMPVQVAEVAEQLQQLPLGCDSAQQQQQLAMAGVADRPRAGHHAVKRYRVAGPPAAPAPAAAAAPMGFRGPQQTGAGAAAATAAGQREPCDEVMQASPMGVQRAAGGLHPMAKSMAAGGGRPAWGINSQQPPHPQQQQQQRMVQQELGGGSGIFNFAPGAGSAAAMGAKVGPGWGQGIACQQQACMNNMGAGQQHMQVAVPMHGRGAAMDAFRCNSVNAMMQCTVTDTLFYT